MDTNQLMANEAKIINTMFRRNNLRAKVDPRHSVCVQTGYLSYALTLAMDERFAKVEALQRELSTVLGNARRRLHLPGDIHAIPVTFPRLALELPHPQPKPLMATNQALTGAAAHTMLIGRSYLEGPQDEFVSFEATPHVLLAGITGAGKSVLLQTMLLSLAANTSPADCKIVLVDLKNEDLVPFERLPHTLTFAGQREAALDALRYVQAEKDKRVAERGYKPFRLVLVIDEMAQLAGNSEAKEILGDLASIGRGKAINVIGATQSVTKEGGMGSLLKANFTVRLVGQVAPGQSQYATNRPHTHAELLPGKGAFLRCEGPNVYRFQSFYADEKNAGQVTSMARQIARAWRGVVTEPVTAKTVVTLVCNHHITTAEPVTEPHRNHLVTSPVTAFPLADKRPLKPAEAAEVRRLAADGMSKNALCYHVYGGKNDKYAAWIGEALNDDGKVIKLRRQA